MVMSSGVDYSLLAIFPYWLKYYTLLVKVLFTCESKGKNFYKILTLDGHWTGE